MNLAALLLVCSLLARAAPTIAVQPLGAFDPRLLEEVRQSLEHTFTFAPVLLPEQKLPEAAFYAPRQRYRGTLLLDALEHMAPRSHARVLGLTTRDISVTKGPIPDWGVFGVAYLGYRPAVVSTFRLRRGRATEALFRQRLVRVALHEVGHTLGLPHCSTPACLMEDARGALKTVDTSTGRFCPACAKRLGKRLQG